MEYQVKEINEKDYQSLFYEKVYGENWKQKVWIDRNTDGHTAGILFEHKKNVKSYGIERTLGQALIYLSRFNRDGIPVPRYSCLVSQEEEVCYFIDNNYYLDYINNIKENAYLTASKGFSVPLEVLDESIVDKLPYSFSDTSELYKYFVSKDDLFVKISICEDNVVGWARYYYKHCPARKAKKIKFFEELRNPKEVLNLYVEPWEGKEMDFKLIMDLLNDPQEQKKSALSILPLNMLKRRVNW